MAFGHWGSLCCVIFACSHVFSQMCSLHFKVILSQLPLEVCCLALPLLFRVHIPSTCCHRFVNAEFRYLTSMQKCVAFWVFFAWLAVKTHWCPRGRMIQRRGSPACMTFLLSRKVGDSLVGIAGYMNRSVVCLLGNIQSLPFSTFPFL